MKKYLILFAFISYSINILAQETEFKYYDPAADAVKEVNDAIAKAKSSNKNVLLQIGGNWCKWCRLYDRWSHSTPLVDSLIKADFVVVHVNFSPENKNPELMKKLGYPQRFGFPVIVILEVEEFLKNWNAEALSEKNYK